ncbi:MAG: acid shock protein [Lachnospiraceae bacterium]|nr:acid shock protein [Lachnospiraceae bacterium]
MKKLLALGLSLVMILSLAACGPEPAETTPEPTTAAPTTVAPTTAAPTTEAPTTAEPTTEPVPEVKIFSYEEYLAAEKDSEVTIEAYVQFSAYNAEYGNTSLFLADEDGAYFVYRMAVTPEQAEQLKEGVKIRVHGFKTEWSGEVEFAEGSAEFEVIEGETFVAEPIDVTEFFGTEDLMKFMNQKIRVSGATVVPSKDADGNEQPFLYKWNGSGAEGDDLYFNVSLGGEIYTLTVESDECGAGTEAYEAVKALEIGQTVEVEGFLYWYEGPQPHVHKLTDMNAKGEGVMTHEEFMDAAMDTKVVVEGWIQQAAYSAEFGNVSLFLADTDGAYYVWRMNVTAEQAAELTEGAKIRVSGMKTAWSGQIEIEDASYEVLGGGAYLAEAKDITGLLGQDEELEALMNNRIALNGMTVVASKDADDQEHAFLYKYNGAGQEGDDLYFTLAKGDGRYVVVVESDEFGSGSEVYEAVKALNIGDVIDLTGFLYWYNGPQPHVSAVAASELPADVTMSYDQFMAAEVETEVIISAYVRLAAYNAEYGNASLFLEDEDGAYYVYRMNVTPEEAAQLTEGAKIRVKGFKNVWSGEVEITDASFELLEAESGIIFGWTNVSYLNDEELQLFMNQGILLEGAVVEPSENADGEKVPFLYKYNGAGQDGDDIYFTVSCLGRSWTFVVETDEFPAGSEVYEAVKALQIGDALDIYAFLYWYEGPQPHVYAIETEQYAKSSEEVMNYYEFSAAEDDSKVVVEGWIQLAAYNAEYHNASLFLHDKVGAYYVYRMEISEEDAERLVVGEYIQITGYKKPWSGLVEIQDVEAYAFPDGSFGEHIADTIDFAYLVENDLAEAFMNNPVEMYRAAVVASTDAEGNEVGWLYKYNGTGSDGDDIYFKVRLDGEIYTVVVESDEFGPGSEVYEAAKELIPGDVVILDAFLYWYNGPQPHVIGIEKTLEKPEDVMTYAEFVAAEDEAPVVVEGFVQLVTAYSEEYGNCSVFLDDVAGAYYVYRLKVSAEDYAKLKPGLYIRVSGFKGSWSGEIELKDAEGFEIPYEGCVDSYLAKPIDIVNIPSVEAAEAYMNALICGKGAKIVASKDADGNEVPFLYKYNGSGQDGDDIYFNVEIYHVTYTVTVETDEFPAGSEVYETVKALQIGDTVDLEGFLYWYEGPQPHISKVMLVPAEPAEAPAETPAN